MAKTATLANDPESMKTKGHSYSKACAQCHASKVKCKRPDNEQETKCERCQKSGLECTERTKKASNACGEPAPAATA